MAMTGCVGDRQHDAIGAIGLRLSSRGGYLACVTGPLAAEGGVIKDTAAQAVFKLRSRGFFSLGEAEGRDWPLSVYELGVPHGIRIRVCRARKDTHAPCDTHGLCPNKEDEHCREGEYSAPVRVRKTVSVLEVAFPPR